MSTLLQEVYDSFFAKVPDEDFTYTANLVYQYLKTAHGYAYKTVPEDLDYTLDIDAVIYISSLATTNGNITITINSVPYTVSILTTDSLISIANKIDIAINSLYTVTTDYSNSYPILTITKPDETDITVLFSDTGITGVVLEITKSYEGSYTDDLGNDSIELISLFMASQHYMSKLTSLENVKQHVGTQNFNKLPSLREKYDNTRLTLKDLDEKIFKFRQEFYTYSN